MTKKDDAELRDEVLSRQLRAALSSKQVPEAWVNEALLVPERHPVPVAPRRESWLLTLFPQLCGLALLFGLILAILIAPDRIAMAWHTVQSVLPKSGISLEWLPTGIPPEAVVAGLLTPILLFVLHQGAQGFPMLRTRGHR